MRAAHNLRGGSCSNSWLQDYGLLLTAKNLLPWWRLTWFSLSAGIAAGIWRHFLENYKNTKYLELRPRALNSCWSSVHNLCNGLLLFMTSVTKKHAKDGYTDHHIGTVPWSKCKISFWARRILYWTLFYCLFKDFLKSRIYEQLLFSARFVKLTR